MKYSYILNIKYPNLGVVQDIPVFVMVAIVLRFFPSCVKEQKTGPDVDGTTSVFILSVLNNIFYNNTFLLFSAPHLALVLCREGGNTEIMCMQEEVHSIVGEYTPDTLGGKRVGLKHLVMEEKMMSVLV